MQRRQSTWKSTEYYEHSRRAKRQKRACLGGEQQGNASWFDCVRPMGDGQPPIRTTLACLPAAGLGTPKPMRGHDTGRDGRGGHEQVREHRGPSAAS